MKSSAVPAGCEGSSVNPSAKLAEPRQDRMVEIFLDQIQEIGGLLAGSDVDRDPKVRSGRAHFDLIVRRVFVVFAAGRNGLASQYAILAQGHVNLPSRVAALFDVTGPDRTGFDYRRALPAAAWLRFR